jgi:hypothetical protein
MPTPQPFAAMCATLPGHAFGIGPFKIALS